MKTRMPIFLLQGLSRSWSRSSSAQPWVCKFCMNGSLRRLSTRDAPPKPYYVTTPIFYVNADPHIGHLYTMVLADILKRWQNLKGKTGLLCTGTDEHGMKIQQAAAKAKTPPKEFCDQTAETFKSLASRAKISHDHFVRTTDEDHKDAVRYFWQMLELRGLIYESKHSGWYCVSDETFYPESTIEKRLDPYTGRPMMVSKETGKEVEWTEEKNYHFKLSAFKDELLAFYKANPKFITPASRMKNVVGAVESGLQDLSISRPVERLSWGVRVPGDDSQTIYVWLDALINYITKAGYPWAPGKEEAGGWPADVQVIGKDILRFHCIYWPAFLMALDLKPPKQFLTHAHWTMNRQKMSKSTGNVVNPFFAMDRFGVEVMRFYLAHDGGIVDDANYDNRSIVKCYKKGLQGGLGNLASRITRSPSWNVRAAVEFAQQTKPSYDGLAAEQVKLLEQVPSQVNEKMEELNPGGALKAIMNVVYETNNFFHHSAPWVMCKQKDQADQVHETIFCTAEAIRMAAIMLQPYMPGKASQLLDMLGVSQGKRSFDYAYFGVDFEYGVPIAPVGEGKWQSLFPPLPVED